MTAIQNEKRFVYHTIIKVFSHEIKLDLHDKTDFCVEIFGSRLSEPEKYSGKPVIALLDRPDEPI